MKIYAELSLCRHFPWLCFAQRPHRDTGSQTTIVLSSYQTAISSHKEKKIGGLVRLNWQVEMQERADLPHRSAARANQPLKMVFDSQHEQG